MKMNIRRRPPKVAKSTVFLPEELVMEVLSFFPVKSLLRMKCVCKSWKTLIADPIFIKMHLKKLSTQDTHFAVVTQDEYSQVSTVISISASRLLENPNYFVSSIFDYDDPAFCFDPNDEYGWMIGSCNGLICLGCYSIFSDYQEHSMCFWNPATRTKSQQKQLGYFRSYQFPQGVFYKFSFGYDNSTDTYKVVLLISKKVDDGLVRPSVRVFTLGDNVWRDIDCFPLAVVFYPYSPVENNGVYLGNSINWLVCHQLKNHRTIKDFVIVSLDLGTETYSQLLLPPCCNQETLDDAPILSVLMDCLCFSYNFKNTHFLIWQMKEFGVEESWTQFLKISYDDHLHQDYFEQLTPLYLAENGDTLILADYGRAVICDSRNYRQEFIFSSNGILWHNAKGYVQSLVSTC